MKTEGSIKVVRDATGQPWLVVGTADGYEAQKITITERHLFDRSWQAIRFAQIQKGDLNPGQAWPAYEVRA